ncbi:MAG: HlyC/CorC family transporter [Roseomonas sp.]|jgi:CBS domain containing-hemolysin-like protein|nr:HlyC/CorC family transporter [Roseomonas sp.]MCA3281948.1 HlyC/CorC family transporter [Roseomonas sp.]MCA3299097.1 HlyC/CorC family transporter [Roseomonas sp.]
MSDASQRPGLFWKIQGMLRRKEAESIRDQVEELIERQEAPSEARPGDGQTTSLDAEERALLGNVLRLRGITAYDVMVPRADIMAIPESHSLTETIALIQTEGHSRYPVYRNGLDDIIGMVHIKDVFAAIGKEEKAFALADVLRRPLFVVPSIPVLDLLLQMREARVHMALVVDEYGGIDGLITIEDLVETIVGDISDEHDEEQAQQITERPDGALDLDARTPIAAFEEKLGNVLTDEERAADIDTVGGLVFTLAGRVPARGELVSHPSGLEFRILEADPRRIRRLRVRRPGANSRVAAE